MGDNTNDGVDRKTASVSNTSTLYWQYGLRTNNRLATNGLAELNTAGSSWGPAPVDPDLGDYVGIEGDYPAPSRPLVAYSGAVTSLTSPSEANATTDIPLRATEDWISAYTRPKPSRSRCSRGCHRVSSCLATTVGVLVVAGFVGWHYAHVADPSKIPND